MSIDSLSYGLSYDPERFVLGTLCRRKHDENNSGKSLRYKSNKLCVSCNNLTKEEKEKYSTRRIDLGNGFSLGQPCKFGHTWEDSDLCLRFTRGRNCVECYRERLNSLRKPEAEKKLILNNEHYLGKLCIKKHEYNGTGKSIRYRKDRGCLECTKERTKTWFANNQAKRAEYLETNKEYFASARKEWERKNPEKAKARYKRYCSTDKGRLKAAQGRLARRAAIKSVHRVPFTTEDLDKIYKAFDGSCAWCGVNPMSEDLTIDHFLPISKGGSHCLGNLVPSCLTCNLSKNNKNPKEWFAKQNFYSKKRWNKILRFLGKSESNYLQIPLF